MATIGLSPDLIEHFKIQDYKHAGPSGQKSVFIVKIDDILYALKIIKSADERTKREIEIYRKYAGNIGLPTVVRVEEYHGETIILEEYIDGEDLHNIMDQYLGNEDKILQLVYDISLILKPIWEDRYIHRDLKPQNIRIKKDGTPVVLDFGIARALDEETITVAGQPFTWSYASPEQLLGKKELISYRTDFFCLGIIAYRLFHGGLPFGNTKALVEKKFTARDLELAIDNSLIAKFYGTVLKYNTSERPGRIETYLKLLQNGNNSNIGA